MVPFTKNILYYFIICISIPSAIFGMSHEESNSEDSLSVEEMEKKLCILHERPNPIYTKEISDSIHFLFAPNTRSKVTYFSPKSEEECNALIERVCSKPEKIWWFVTPNTKKFNLEEKLKQKGLLPYPLPAMICALPGKRLEPNAADPSISINEESSGPGMITYTLLKDKAVITSGSLLFHENWVGIHTIETVQEHRRKGFATRLLNHLLRIAQQRNTHYALLESSPEAYQLYTKFGFKEMFTTYIYYRE